MFSRSRRSANPGTHRFTGQFQIASGTTHWCKTIPSAHARCVAASAYARSIPTERCHIAAEPYPIALANCVALKSVVTILRAFPMARAHDPYQCRSCCSNDLLASIDS